MNALRTLGATAERVSWDDPHARWEAYSHVMVSSTWDSVERPVEYLAWARSVTSVTRLVNPVELIEWNLDKVHHRELNDRGVPIIPTVWISPDEDWTAPGETEFVVKPSVSAGGRSTARYAAGDPAAGAQVRALQAAGQTVMVQEYQASIDAEGELDLIFVDGRFSHAVRKHPVLRVGEGLVTSPWERMAWAGLASPTPRQLGVAEDAMAVICDRFPDVPAYGRIDLVQGTEGGPLLLEAEMIDPYLSLDLSPEAALRLAAALTSR